MDIYIFFGGIYMPNYNLDEIISAVEALIGRIRTARPSGTRQEQYSQFIGYRQEIDRLEDRIDVTEDKVKDDYRAGIITRAEYKNIDRILDTLDERLDRAEDQLERIFGMDD